jgi:hypothetical protein
MFIVLDTELDLLLQVLTLVYCYRNSPWCISAGTRLGVLVQELTLVY